MTLTLDLTPDLQERLSVAAAAQGISPGELAAKVLEKSLSSSDHPQDTVALLRSWRDSAFDGSPFVFRVCSRRENEHVNHAHAEHDVRSTHHEQRTELRNLEHEPSTQHAAA